MSRFTRWKFSNESFQSRSALYLRSMLLLLPSRTSEMRPTQGSSLSYLNVYNILRLTPNPTHTVHQVYQPQVIGGKKGDSKCEKDLWHMVCNCTRGMLLAT